MISEFCIALHILTYLCHTNELVNSEQLAINVCSNPVQIRRCIAKLKKENLVKSKGGAYGGYTIVESAKKTNLKKLYEIFEIDLITPFYKTGDADCVCPISSGISKEMSNIHSLILIKALKILDLITIEDLSNKLINKNYN